MEGPMNICGEKYISNNCLHHIHFDVMEVGQDENQDSTSLTN